MQYKYRPGCTLETAGSRIGLFLCLLAGISSGGAYAQQGGFEQPGSACRKLFLTVTDETLRPIVGATVKFLGGWTAATDFHGDVMMDCPPGNHFPFTVDVSAPGFEAQSGTIFTGHTRFFLQRTMRAANTYPAAGTTVKVEELPREIQEKSAQLRKEASEAIERGDNAGAEKLLSRALELTPSEPEIYNDIACTLVRRGRPAGAAASLLQGLDVASHNPLLMGNLGLVRWLQGLRDESYKLLVDADARGFATPSAHFVLGVLYLENGEPKKSIRQLSSVNARQFKLRDLFYSLSLRDVGKVKEAADKFRDYLKRNPASFALTAPPAFEDQKP
jgi:hypothetical protein